MAGFRGMLYGWVSKHDACSLESCYVVGIPWYGGCSLEPCYVVVIPWYGTCSLEAYHVAGFLSMMPGL